MSEKKARNETPTRDELLERSGDLARRENILEAVDADVRDAGFAGPTETVLLVYLAVTTRLLADPVSVAVHGPSAAGKSRTIKQALAFHPPEAYVN